MHFGNSDDIYPHEERRCVVKSIGVFYEINYLEEEKRKKEKEATNAKSW